jgi:hypothetical protein
MGSYLQASVRLNDGDILSSPQCSTQVAEPRPYNANQCTQNVEEWAGVTHIRFRIFSITGSHIAEAARKHATPSLRVVSPEWRLEGTTAGANLLYNPTSWDWHEIVGYSDSGL